MFVNDVYYLLEDLREIATHSFSEEETKEAKLLLSQELTTDLIEKIKEFVEKCD